MITFSVLPLSACGQPKSDVDACLIIENSTHDLKNEVNKLGLDALASPKKLEVPLKKFMSELKKAKDAAASSELNEKLNDALDQGKQISEALSKGDVQKAISIGSKPGKGVEILDICKQKTKDK
ncbi:hypothetical protein [Boudabousia tangfeifanii]|uniref:hypothetical protein n=1 Tax=Boudabousia tangfeifanii TaxID=1912795 RepID=UPI0012ED4EDA|nr:hypothetical protein [Boudabousia tangfeifanii]